MTTRRSSERGLGGFFAFRWMITPFLIRVAFFVGLAYFLWRGGVLLEAASMTGETMSDRLNNTIGTALAVGYWWIGATLALRLACEGAMVLFRIHEALSDMRKRGELMHDAVLQIRRNTAD